MWPFKKKEEVISGPAVRLTFVVTYTDGLSDTVEGTSYDWERDGFLTIEDEKISGDNILAVQAAYVKSVKSTPVDEDTVVS